MSIEYAIRDLLIGDPVIVASVPAARIYPAPLKDNPTYPAITYNQVSQDNISSHSGNSNLAQTRLQLTLWAATYDTAQALRTEIKRVVRDYRGVVRSIRIDRVRFDNDLTGVDPDTQIQQRFIDLLIWHSTTY